MLKLSLPFKSIEIVTILYYRMQCMQIKEMIEWGHSAPTSYFVIYILPTPPLVFLNGV
jgi:hypothetical protein